MDNLFWLGSSISTWQVGYCTGHHPALVIVWVGSENHTSWSILVH